MPTTLTTAAAAAPTCRSGSATKRRRGSVTAIARLLERRRAQPLGHADEVVGERPAARAALEVRVEQRALEVGQLAVQAERRVLARAVASPAGCPHRAHVDSDGLLKQ